MAAIKSLDVSAQKWTRRAAVAGEDYRQGVENPRMAWDTAAIAGDANYRQAVTAAATAGRFAAGVRRAGADKWRSNSLAKGPSRFAEGVQLAVGEWQKGFAPSQAALSALQLPPRGPTGSPQNMARVQAVSTALRALRERKS